jgi:hypothetical protein
MGCGASSYEQDMGDYHRHRDQMGAGSGIDPAFLARQQQMMMPQAQVMHSQQPQHQMMMMQPQVIGQGGTAAVVVAQPVGQPVVHAQAVPMQHTVSQGP